ncbi:ChaN family lipoprotein [Endozoicomonas sp. Mp262]|uniref:ChaN family lipoprotein n=1 Tax=Endozoicomonas sp. Mp262 TaxID=2919499 RepID=UPI0021D8F41B
MIKRAFSRLFGLLVVSLLVTGCEKFQPKGIARSGIWDSFRQDWITEEEFSESLGSADFIIIGDLQNAPSLGHQLTLLMDSMKKRGKVELLALDELSASYSHDGKKAAEGVFREKYDAAAFEKYKPLFQWADREGISITGTALPPEQLQSLKNKEERKKFAVKVEGSLTRESLRELTQTLECSHRPGSLSTDYLVLAHQFKDYTMADRLLSEGKKSLLVTRAFHARLDLGVNRYIKVRKPSSSVKSVLMYSSLDDSLSSPGDEEMKSWYDYIWVNPGAKGR